MKDVPRESASRSRSLQFLGSLRRRGNVALLATAAPMSACSRCPAVVDVHRKDGGRSPVVGRTVRPLPYVPAPPALDFGGENSQGFCQRRDRINGRGKQADSPLRVSFPCSDGDPSIVSFPGFRRVHGGTKEKRPGGLRRSPWQERWAESAEPFGKPMRPAKASQPTGSLGIQPRSRMEQIAPRTGAIFFPFS